MTDTALATFTLAAAAVGLVVLASSRLSQRTRVPLPALVLVGAAVAGQLDPGLHHPGQQTVQRVVSLALVAVLFDGGLHLGVARLRGALVPTGLVGVVGTFVTAALGACAVHLLVAVSWYPSVLVATALAPTDPAVVFSVLGRRRVEGRSGTILEAESGANDPVGIALMAALVTAGGLSGHGAAHVATTFALQMAVGLAVGLVGGRLLVLLMRRVALPAEGLYPLRTLASAYGLYAAGTLAHGSGFLAVFVAGIVVGDVRAPFKADIERFHGALASLGEVVAFVVLGLTVDLATIAHPDVWATGLAVAAVFVLVVRPLAVGPLMLAVPMAANERAFVVAAGLKGAVPILLAGDLFTAHLPDVGRLYGIVVVAVAASVVVQGGTIGWLTALLRLPVSMVAPTPWAVGVRLADAPPDLVRLTVRAGAAADGVAVADLDDLPEGAWISLLVRDGRLAPVRGDTVLRAGDDLTILGVAGDQVPALRRALSSPAGGWVRGDGAH